MIPNIPTQMNSGMLQVPAVNPISYQFQVIEYTTNGVVVKVELQVQVTEHGSMGQIIKSSGFIPIPRIQLPFVEYTK